MPCLTCGALAIQFGAYTICPKCNKVPLLKREEAILRLFQNEKAIESQVYQIMRNRLDKTDLLLKLLWVREAYCRSFWEKYQTFDTNKFLSSNLLISRITKDNSFTGKYRGTKKDVEKLADGFKKIIESKENRLLLIHGLGEPFELHEKIRILFNERYFPILKTYEDNDIWQSHKANKKIDEYSKLLDSEVKNSQKEENYSPKRFIEEFYPTIHQFYCCFLRNEIFKEVFGSLNNYKADLNPRTLLNFVNSYPFIEGALFHTSLSEFITRAKKYFGFTQKRIKEVLLFNRENTSPLPIFLEINGRVYISHKTTLFFYILLHAVIYKDLFDQETVKRSKEFEKREVKEAFQKIGWKYIANVKDKKNRRFEIDGIAFSKKQIVIIECKAWKLRPFYEYQTFQSYLIRDIKGIIDGKKYTNKTPKKIPSLIEKIKYIKANMPSLGLDITKFDIIEGIVVLRDFPPISEYKGIHVLGIKEIAKRYGPENNS
jgi:hypothetical protein